MKRTIFFLPIVVLFSSCCNLDFWYGDEGCADQIFTETRRVTVNAPYTVNTSKTFLEASNISAATIRKALNIPNESFTVKRIEINSGRIKYDRLEANTAGAINVNIAIVGKTLNQLLLKETNLLLPLYDIPPVFLSEGININQYLNTKGIGELKKILMSYATLLNDDGISFVLTGDPTPGAATANFKLEMVLDISIVYEVCRYVPLGQGERLCE